MGFKYWVDRNFQMSIIMGIYYMGDLISGWMSDYIVYYFVFVDGFCFICWCWFLRISCGRVLRG